MAKSTPIDRLIKLMGMTGSSHDGEALNALRLAQKVLAETGLTWESALRGRVVERVVYVEREAPKRPNPEASPHSEERLRAMVRDLLNVEDELTDWEADFLTNMHRWKRAYSFKQGEVIYRIWKEVFQKRGARHG